MDGAEGRLLPPADAAARPGVDGAAAAALSAAWRSRRGRRFLDGGGERTLRLAFSSVAAGASTGRRRLAEVIKTALRQPRGGGPSARWCGSLSGLNERGQTWTS